MSDGSGDEDKRFRDWQASIMQRANYVQELIALRSRPHELEMAALAACRNFALEGFRACYLLNGGGAIAVTAIRGAFSPIISDRFIAIAASCFFLGLLCTLIANLLAYFAENKRSHEKSAEVDFYEASIRTAYRQNGGEEVDTDAIWKRSVDRANEADARIWAAIGFILVAIASFGAGCVVLLWQALAH